MYNFDDFHVIFRKKFNICMANVRSFYATNKNKVSFKTYLFTILIKSIPSKRKFKDV